MNVLIDARKLGDGGIGVYIENLVNGFLGLPSEHTKDFNLCLLVPDLSKSWSRQGKTELIKRTLSGWQDRIELIADDSKKYSFREYLLMAWRQREVLRKTTIFHSPHYTLPFFVKIPTVVTIHDIIHITHPDTYWHRIGGKLLIRSALERASRVITVSHASRQRLGEEFSEIQTPISVIPNGLQKGICAASENEIRLYSESQGITRPYFIFVGSDRPHKGFKVLYRAWAMLGAKYKAAGKQIPMLVVVGDRYSTATKAEVSSLGLSSVVKFLNNYVTPEELAVLYSGSEAVVIPSREEGFGLMALEALSCKTRIVASPVPSLQEICGGIGYFAEDFSAEALLKAIISCDEDDKKEQRIVDGQKRSLKYNIYYAARKTLWVYRDVAKKLDDARVSIGNFAGAKKKQFQEKLVDDSWKQCSNS